MTDPLPQVTSTDGSTVLSLVRITRARDPRMDEALFEIVGPSVRAESVIDAYLIDNLFSELRSLFANQTSVASFGLGELAFRRAEGSEISIQLGGGPYVGGTERAWRVELTATDREVLAFTEALETSWRDEPAV